MNVRDFSSVEQRAHARYHVKEGAYTVIKIQQDTKLTIGQIVDISKGGLAFKYIANGEPVKGNHKLDIYFIGQGIQLKNISFKVVSDLELENSYPFSSILMRRGSLQFQNLEIEQKNELAKFIKKYTAEYKN